MAKTQKKGTKRKKRRSTRRVKRVTKKTERKVEKKKVKKSEGKDVDIADIINETAKLLSLGVPEKDIREVMKDTGMPNPEIDRVIKSAKEIYAPTKHGMGEFEADYYEPNGWLMLITVVFLIFVAIILTIMLIR